MGDVDDGEQHAGGDERPPDHDRDDEQSPGEPVPVVVHLVRANEHREQADAGAEEPQP